MKKILVAILTFVAILTGCAKNSSESNNPNNMDNEKKILVAYFSATGTTRQMAEMLADEVGAALFEIVPEQPYTDADLDWRNDNSRSSLEMKDKEHSRPAIKDKVENMEQYETIYVGFPIWWYTCPTIINTFLESYDFKGKTIVPFATSGGSPVEPCVPDMKKSAPGATFLSGKLLNDVSRKSVKEWVDRTSI